MKFLCILGALCGLAVPALSLDRSAFSVTQYDLDVRVEPEQQRLAVRGKLTLRNDSKAPQKDLSLQISSSLDWRSISVDGKPVEFVSQAYTSDIDHSGALSEALISLPREIQPNATVQLEVGYEGVIVLDTTRLTRIGVPEAAAKNTDWDRIGRSFGAVRGVGYVVWYPLVAEAASLSQENSVAETIAQWTQREEVAGMRVTFCLWRNAGDPLTALMNDRLAEGSAGADAAGCNEHEFTQLSQTVPLFVIGRYETLTQPGVSLFYLQGHTAEAQNYALAIGKVLPFIMGWFGSPRRAARYIELPDSAAAPYENGGVLLTPLSVDASLAETTAVHQLAHAAFPSPRLWIYEGLAHFAQAVYKERQSSRATAIQFMSDYLPAVVQAENSLAGEQNKISSEQSLINTGIEELYRSKSMYVWWMLRDMLGEPALKHALSAYRPDQDTDPSYLQHLLETQSKRDLKWFFDDWVYHDKGLPDFRVDSVYPSETTPGNYLVTVTVENLGEAGAEVPVTLRSSGHEKTQRLEVREKSKGSIRFVTQSPSSEVVVNDGSVPESDMSNNRFTIQK